MKICLFPNCGTILRKENQKEGFCFLHQRIMEQNDLIYSRKKFYKELKHWCKKNKDKKVLLSKYEIKRLKEISAPEDILGVDRL